ncbi:MAG TPA: hypothetical protein DCO77_00145 [Nitrospiraceae bacterium]|nr:hypothetical protein [Nitrospiraceae bacterium]
MFVIGNLLMGIAEVLRIVLNMYMWVIIIRALISWVNPDPYNPVVQILQKLTEPVLKPLRNLIPTYRMGIDVTPLIAILIIIFLNKAVVQSLFSLGRSLQ